MSIEICVVGAGIVGLATAVQIQENIVGVPVTIIAEKITPHTTSDGAGGFWQPYLLGDTPLHKLRQWSLETYQHLQQLTRSGIGRDVGVSTCSGIQIHTDPNISAPFWKDIVDNFHYLTEAELQTFPDHRRGWSYRTITCEGGKYLPWLMDRFVKKGGKIVQKRISDFEELYTTYDIIVNCTGNGAKALCADQNINPSKGLVIRVEAPWIREFLLDDDNGLYILVNSDCVILGGTDEDSDSLHVDVYEKQRIWDGCCKLLPSLKNARHLRDWVGLRPSRTSIRLELETVHRGNTVRKIVHNYGHGGGGITLHWGCAQEAAHLVQVALAELTTAKL